MIEILDDAVARCTRCWLMGVGLQRAADEVGTHPNRRQIPTPGMDGLVQTLAALAGEIADCARSGQAALTTGDRVGVTIAAELADTAAERADMAIFELAQIALGVSQLAVPTPAADQLELASLTVLAARDRSTTGTAFILRARTRAELKVEIAGLVSRMLFNWGGLATIGMDGASVSFAVTGRTLQLTAEASGPVEAMTQLGWEGGTTWRTRTWNDDVVIAEVSDLIMRTLLDAIGIGLGQIAVEVHHHDPTSRPIGYRLAGRFRPSA